MSARIYAILTFAIMAQAFKFGAGAALAFDARCEQPDFLQQHRQNCFEACVDKQFLSSHVTQCIEVLNPAAPRSSPDAPATPSAASAPAAQAPQPNPHEFPECVTSIPELQERYASLARRAAQKREEFSGLISREYYKIGKLCSVPYRTLLADYQQSLNAELPIAAIHNEFTAADLCLVRVEHWVQNYEMPNVLTSAELIRRERAALAQKLESPKQDQKKLLAAFDEIRKAKAALEQLRSLHFRTCPLKNDGMAPAHPSDDKFPSCAHSIPDLESRYARLKESVTAISRTFDDLRRKKYYSTTSVCCVSYAQLEKDLKLSQEADPQISGVKAKFDENAKCYQQIGHWVQHYDTSDLNTGDLLRKEIETSLAKTLEPVANAQKELGVSLDEIEKSKLALAELRTYHKRICLPQGDVTACAPTEPSTQQTTEKTIAPQTGASASADAQGGRNSN